MKLTWGDFVFDEVLGPLLQFGDDADDSYPAFRKGDRGEEAHSVLPEVRTARTSQNRETSRDKRPARMVGQPTFDLGRKTPGSSDMDVGWDPVCAQEEKPSLRLTKRGGFDEG